MWWEVEKWILSHCDIYRGATWVIMSLSWSINFEFASKTKSWIELHISVMYEILDTSLMIFISWCVIEIWVFIN